MVQAHYDKMVRWFASMVCLNSLIKWVEINDLTVEQKSIQKNPGHFAVFNRLTSPFFSLPKLPAPALAMASGPPATDTTFLAASVRPNNTARAPQAPNLNQHGEKAPVQVEVIPQQMPSLPDGRPEV